MHQQNIQIYKVMRNWIKNPVQNSAELYKVLVQFDSIQSSKTWYLVVHTPVASRFSDRNLNFLKNFGASKTLNPVSSLLSRNKNVRVFCFCFFQYVPDVFRICVRSNFRVAQKREVCNKPSISRKLHHSCKNFRFRSLRKPENPIS